MEQVYKAELEKIQQQNMQLQMQIQMQIDGLHGVLAAIAASTRKQLKLQGSDPELSWGEPYTRTLVTHPLIKQFVTNIRDVISGSTQKFMDNNIKAVLQAQ